MKIFAIRIAEISNKLLIKDGWTKHAFVREEQDDWLDCTTFELAPNKPIENIPCYFSRLFAEKMIKEVSKHFEGVEFEVVEFTSIP